MIKDCRYLISTQNLPKASLNFSYIVQTVKFTSDIIFLLKKQLNCRITNKFYRLNYVKSNQNTLQLLDLLSQIVYTICFINVTHKAKNIYWSLIKCKQEMRLVLTAELYIYKFDIKKLHQEKYLIMQAKLYQHQHYRIIKIDIYKQANIKQVLINQANMEQAKMNQENTE